MRAAVAARRLLQAGGGGPSLFLSLCFLFPLSLRRMM